jgi:predicted metal-dependent phosphoesterase TrpH
MKSKVNLHIHTKYSDGDRTVPEVVSKLNDAGIEYFAITDHDTVEGNFEVAEYAEKYKMKCFNGIELTCRFLHGEISPDDLCGCHILGLGIKIDEIQKRLKELNENKHIKVQKLFKLLVDNGYNLDSANIDSTFKSIIKELMAKDYAQDRNDCKTRILCKAPYRQYYIPNMGVQMAIETIQKSGGLAIWAHPFKVPDAGRKEGLNNEQVSELLDRLREYGLDGIEVYYQHFTVEQIRFLESLADSKRLFKSISTDYHKVRNGVEDDIFFDVEGIIPDETIIATLESRMENKKNALL